MGDQTNIHDYYVHVYLNLNVLDLWINIPDRVCLAEH